MKASRKPEATVTNPADNGKGYDPDTPDDRVVFNGSRRRWALLIGGSLVFVAIGASDIQRHHPVGWLPVTFFGFCSLLFGYLLVRPGRLQVTNQAVTLDQLWHHPTYQFHRCGEFRVKSIPVGRQMVRFDYDGQDKRRSQERPKVLPATFGMSAQDLADLLNERRALRKQ